MPCRPRAPSRRVSGDSFIERSIDTSTSTAVTMRYPMHVISVHDFLALEAIEPHQTLLAKGLLKQWDESMTKIFFLSHQWTSFNHPDASGDQLRSFQRVLRRMMAGSLPTVECDLVTSELGLGKFGKVEAKDWPLVVSGAYVWMDYFSVPVWRRLH